VPSALQLPQRPATPDAAQQLSTLVPYTNIIGTTTTSLSDGRSSPSQLPRVPSKGILHRVPSGMFYYYYYYFTTLLVQLLYNCS
jgi:hypothetical protein